LLFGLRDPRRGLAVAGARTGVRVASEQASVPALLQRLGAARQVLRHRLADRPLTAIDRVVRAELAGVERAVGQVERLAHRRVVHAFEALRDVAARGDGVPAPGVAEIGALADAPPDRSERLVVAVAAVLVGAAAG